MEKGRHPLHLVTAGSHAGYGYMVPLVSLLIFPKVTPKMAAENVMLNRFSEGF